MKLAFRLAVGVVILAVALAIVVPMFLINSVVKRGIETAGPVVAKVEVKLDRVNISVFSGAGQLSGLFVGNPEGYKTPSAIKGGLVSVAIEPRSVFKDKVVVKSVRINSPEITFEGGLSGNNLKQILDNIETSIGSSKTADKTPSSGKKIQVDDLLIEGAKVNLSTGVMGGKTISVPLPDVHLRDLGKGSDGISGPELAQKIMKEIVSGVLTVASRELGRVGQEAVGNATDAGTAAIGGIGDALQGVGGLLKKKK